MAALITLAAIGLFAAGATVGIIGLVCVAIRREEKNLTLTSEATDHVTRAERRGVRTGHRCAAGRTPARFRPVPVRQPCPLVQAVIMHDTNSIQAVVLGASMAGLLAAQVLAERFEQVVVIERDMLPPAGEHRRGVPHGRHLHGLHLRGREILDELFPGFTNTLTAAGAVCGDVLGDVRWQPSGHQLRQADIGLPGLFAQPTIP